MDKITLIKRDLIQSLAEVSSYHPDKYSTQLMITTAVNKSRELFDVVDSQQQEIGRLKGEVESLRCCGNCNWVVKGNWGGLFCTCNQADTEHNECCGAWELPLPKAPEVG